MNQAIANAFKSAEVPETNQLLTMMKKKAMI